MLPSARKLRRKKRKRKKKKIGKRNKKPRLDQKSTWTNMATKPASRLKKAFRTKMSSMTLLLTNLDLSIKTFQMMKFKLIPIKSIGLMI